MSTKVVHSIGERAAEAALEAAWAQWSFLTAAAVPADQRRDSSIIDPEGLILASLALGDRERRLNDFLAGWARVGSSLLSIQRLKSLAKGYPDAVRKRIPEFASYAADAGDRRWRAHATQTPAAPRAALRAKYMGPLRVLGGPMLMLRLRAGMGVGTKADLLTYLLGLRGAAADLKAITLATGYSDRAMRTAAEEMGLAGFIEPIEGPPSAYRAEAKAWALVLDHGRRAGHRPPEPTIPTWRYWSVVFAFLTSVME